MRAMRLGEKEKAKKLMRGLLDGYVGCADLPALLYVEELLDVFPDAKVVLVERDPVKWWASMSGILDHAESWFLPALTSIAPALRWFPPLVVEWRLTCDALRDQETDRGKGEYGPCESLRQT